MDDEDSPAAPPPLTFAIPYFRGKDYLREAIDSVIAQTMTDWNLIVVDDRGPEPADDLVESYGDPRIFYVRNEVNLGIGGNWNECIRLSRSPLVTLLHADDRLLPDYAAVVLRAADSHPQSAAVFTDAVNIDANGQRTTTLADRVKNHLPRPSADHMVHGDSGLAGLLFGNYIICPSLCLRRDEVGAAPFRTDLRFVLDWEFTTRLLLEGKALFGVRTPHLEYRRHGGTETSLLTADASRFAEELEFLRERESQCIALGFKASARTARRRLTVRGHIVVRALLDLVSGRPAAARTKLVILWSDLRRRDRLRVDDPDPQ